MSIHNGIFYPNHAPMTCIVSVFVARSCVCLCKYVCLYVCVCMCMYVYVCVCMCMYVYVCVCMCMYVYVCVCMCMYVHVCVCISICVYVCVCAYVYICVCMCMQICMCMYVYVCVCMSICVYVCVCPCVYICVCIYLYVCICMSNNRVSFLPIHVLIAQSPISPYMHRQQCFLSTHSYFDSNVSRLGIHELIAVFSFYTLMSEGSFSFLPIHVFIAVSPLSTYMHREQCLLSTHP